MKHSLITTLLAAGVCLAQEQPPTKAPTVPDILSHYYQKPKQSRIVDFSHAGNQTKLPADLKKFHAKDFGALPNDDKDDSEALQKAFDAIEANQGGELLFENGEYLVSQSLLVQTGNLRVQGAGDTVIVLNSSADIGYSTPLFRIGKLNANTKTMHTLTTGVLRHGSKIKPTSPKVEFKVGDILDLYGINTGGKLSYLLTEPTQQEDVVTREHRLFSAYTPYRRAVTVTEVFGPGMGFRFSPAMPIPWDGPTWLSNFRMRTDMLKGVHFNRLKLQFKGRKPIAYGISVYDAADIVLENLVVHNFCNAISMRDVKNGTINQIEISGDQALEGTVRLNRSWDCLVQNIHYSVTAKKGVGLMGSAHGNVFRKITFDQGGNILLASGDGFAMNNLFEQIDGARITGDGACSPHSGNYNIFWNINCGKSLNPSHLLFSGYTNDSSLLKERGGKIDSNAHKGIPGSIVVGVRCEDGLLHVGGSTKDVVNDWIYTEKLNQGDITPASLYLDQCAKKAK
ncbi:MAG: hypothetical protein H7A51_17505 [Akkermansiaceae bacterium]|nr:hypothetical protein [Akkermansiaceae bacterium]